jgi:hypothetical protein
MEFTLGRYEFKHFGEHHWRKVSEKAVLEKLADHFDPLTPVLAKMLCGEEIITAEGIYRKIYTQDCQPRETFNTIDI